ncbi:MAG: aspartyl/asparaginyl beta-hydroxylase domain-containing protein [Verrucomicrobiota bacterium]
MNDDIVESCDIHINLPRLKQELLCLWDKHIYGNNLQWKKIHLVDCFDRRDMSQPPEWAEIITPRSALFHKNLCLERYVFSPNKNMEQCLYLKELLTQITTDISHIYICDISILEAGGKVGIHKDHDIRPYMKDETRWKRFHIPIFTNPDAKFVIQNRTYVLKEGLLYKLRTVFPHSVANGSATEDRYHLILDVNPQYINPQLEWVTPKYESTVEVIYPFMKNLVNRAKYFINGAK